MAHINKNVSTMAMPSGMNRMGQFPLDMSSVYYDRASLEAYATSGSIAYVGQIVSLVDETNKKVTVYSIQNTEGLLKEVGTVPVGDGSSVVVDAEGKVALKGVAELVFEREVEGGEKEEVQYQALMTKNGLVWVEPSKTTVEGLATLIEALTVRVKAAEDAIDAIEADYLKAEDKTELSEAIAAEAEIARAAEKANADAIKAIADDYLKTADKYDDTALTVRVKAIEDDYLKTEDKYDDTALAARVKAIEDDYLVEADKTELSGLITNEKNRAEGIEADFEERIAAIEGDYLVEADKNALQEQITANANAITALTDGIDPDKIDGLTDLVEWAAEHAPEVESIKEDIEANAKAIEDHESFAAETYETKADASAKLTEAKGYTDTEVAKDRERLVALENVKDAYKTADTELHTTISAEIDADVKAAIDAEVLRANGAYDASGAAATAKSEAIADAEGKIATAKSEAIEAAANDAASKYATTGALSDLETALDARLDVLEAYEHDTYATKDELKATDDKAVSNTNLITNLTGRLDGIVAQGGEPNVINNIKVNGVAQEIVEKTVDIIVPTKFTDLSDDSGFDTRITAAQNRADKGVGDADAAAKAASAAQAKADANASAIDAHGAAIELLQQNDQTHTSQIAALQQHDNDHTALYNTLNNTVSTHGTDIAGLKTSKADVTVTNSLASRISANETAISTLNDVTILGINQTLAQKANSDNVYSISAADEKFLAKADYTAYDDSSLKKLVSDEAARADAAEKANAKAITDEESRATGAETRIEGLVTAEVTRAKAAEEKNAADIVAINALLNTVNNEDSITSLKELALWVEEHGEDAAEMADAISSNADAIKTIYDASGEKATGVLVDEIARVEKKADDNAAAILAINNGETGILAAAKAYADEKFNAVPVADDDTIIVNDKKLSVAKVSTDILEQGALELILFGGTAAGHIVD